LKACSDALNHVGNRNTVKYEMCCSRTRFYRYGML